MREKVDYRPQLEITMRHIEERFPKSLGMLTTEQTAEYLGCNVKTVQAAIKRRKNPLPAMDIGNGRTIYRIPIASLARWSLGG